jgi:hypothetical protein
MYPATVVGMPKSLITGMDYRLFTSKILPGDFLLTKSKPYKGSNATIKGSFTHLIVYTGPVNGSLDQDHFIRKPRELWSSKMHRKLASEDPVPRFGLFKRSITHAISEGVVCQDLLDVWHHYDWICAVRPWSDEQEQKSVIDAALSQVGKEYNFDFATVGEPSLYCTELGVYCCEKAAIMPPEKIRRMTKFWKPWAREEITIADYFVKAFNVVCATLSCNAPSHARRSSIAETMREKLLKAPDLAS